MAVSKKKAKELLQAHGLRATAPRVSVLTALANQEHPVAYTELVRGMGRTSFDPATVYRNLTRLVDAGVARIVSRAGGMARYELVPNEGEDQIHAHPHFLCNDCGVISCLSDTAVEAAAVGKRWKASVKAAAVQLQGSCPECLAG